MHPRIHASTHRYVPPHLPAHTRCNAAGIEAIISTTSQDQVPRHTGPYDCCNATDMADLVEYCYGNASTRWGAQRIQDGHPAPYRVKFLELGRHNV